MSWRTHEPQRETLLVMRKHLGAVQGHLKSNVHTCKLGGQARTSRGWNCKENAKWELDLFSWTETYLGMIEKKRGKLPFSLVRHWRAGVGVPLAPLMLPLPPVGL